MPLVIYPNLNLLPCHLAGWYQIWSPRGRIFHVASRSRLSNAGKRNTEWRYWHGLQGQQGPRRWVHALCIILVRCCNDMIFIIFFSRPLRYLIMEWLRMWSKWQPRAAILAARIMVQVILLSEVRKTPWLIFSMWNLYFILVLPFFRAYFWFIPYGSIIWNWLLHGLDVAGFVISVCYSFTHSNLTLTRGV